MEWRTDIEEVTKAEEMNHSGISINRILAMRTKDGRQTRSNSEKHVGAGWRAY